MEKTAVDHPMAVLIAEKVYAQRRGEKGSLIGELILKFSREFRCGGVFISQPVVLQVGDLTLNTVTREVRRGENLIELAPREFLLLDFLMRSTAPNLWANGYCRESMGL